MTWGLVRNEADNEAQIDLEKRRQMDRHVWYFFPSQVTSLKTSTPLHPFSTPPQTDSHLFFITATKASTMTAISKLRTTLIRKFPTFFTTTRHEPIYEPPPPEKTLLDLPYEILYTIFTSLLKLSDRYRLGLVNKHLYGIACSPRLLRQYCRSHYGTDALILLDTLQHLNQPQIMYYIRHSKIDLYGIHYGPRPTRGTAVGLRPGSDPINFSKKEVIQLHTNHHTIVTFAFQHLIQRNAIYNLKSEAINNGEFDRIDCQRIRDSMRPEHINRCAEEFAFSFYKLAILACQLHPNLKGTRDKIFDMVDAFNISSDASTVNRAVADEIYDRTFKVLHSWHYDYTYANSLSVRELFLLLGMGRYLWGIQWDGMEMTREWYGHFKIPSEDQKAVQPSKYAQAALKRFAVIKFAPKQGTSTNPDDYIFQVMDQAINVAFWFPERFEELCQVIDSWQEDTDQAYFNSFFKEKEIELTPTSSCLPFGKGFNSNLPTKTIWTLKAKGWDGMSLLHKRIVATLMEREMGKWSYSFLLSSSPELPQDPAPPVTQEEQADAAGVVTQDEQTAPAGPVTQEQQEDPVGVVTQDEQAAPAGSVTQEHQQAGPGGLVTEGQQVG